jgi:hypothetical protein
LLRWNLWSHFILLVPPSLTLGLLFLESLTAFQKLVSFSNLKFLSYGITQFQFN